VYTTAPSAALASSIVFLVEQLVLSIASLK
jgi:hypothetical protein